jgi:DNA-binding transcriptional ArsR family regulator
LRRVKHLLMYLLLGTRGGETRARILHELRLRPQNAHRLSKLLKLDYKTVEHHLRVLLQNRLLERHGGYGALYFLSAELEVEMATFDEIWKGFENQAARGEE